DPRSAYRSRLCADQASCADDRRHRRALRRRAPRDASDARVGGPRRIDGHSTPPSRPPITVAIVDQRRIGAESGPCIGARRLATSAIVCFDRSLPACASRNKQNGEAQGGTMAKMRAIEAGVEVLRREGVTVAFGLPGAAINPLYAAMRTIGGIDHVLARHVEG